MRNEYRHWPVLISLDSKISFYRYISLRQNISHQRNITTTFVGKSKTGKVETNSYPSI